jgi:hypothetical protein
MPRSFTINFTHKGKAYVAVVSHLHNSVCVYIPDGSLHHIVPNGRFTYDMQQGLPTDTIGLNPLQNLIADVMNATEPQLKVQQTDSD